MESKFFRINTIKVREQDKYIITCGKYQAREEVFDSKEEAEAFLNITWNPQLEPYIISMSQAISDFIREYEHCTETIEKENNK